MASICSSNFSQSPAWGSANFKGCRFCRRDRSYPNPDRSQVQEKPFLPFRSERHPECLACLAKLRKTRPLSNTAAGKNELAKKCKEDEAIYEQHIEGLLLFEEEILNREKPRSKYRNKFGGDDGIDVGMPEEVVDMVDESAVEMRRFKGIMWPCDVFEEKEKRKPKPEELTTIEFHKQKYTGVLRNRECGMPIGCWEVYDTVKASAQHKVTIANSADALCANEVEDSFKKARKSFESTGAEVTDKETGESFLKATPSQKKQKDEFDDLFDWGFAFGTSGVKPVATAKGTSSSAGGSSSGAGVGGVSGSIGGGAAMRTQ